MKLSQLLEGVSVTKLFQTMYGRMVVTHDVEVSKIQYDSRKVEEGDCFIAIRGTASDGHSFVQEAVQKGAKVVVMERDEVVPDSFFMHAGVIKIVVPDSRKALAVMSANYFGHPSSKLRLIGVTGTNGKTTTTHLIKSILEAAGQKVGLIGTIEYKIGNEIVSATHTTPESLELNDLLSTMVQRGCTSVSMEVSSHALHQSRVYGLKYEAAVFTNLSQDHLDYHGTMEEYFRAKKTLFDEMKPIKAVTNADDPWGRRIIEGILADSITYGMTGSADVSARNVNLSLEGTRFEIAHKGKTTPITSPLVGRFNVYNILAAFSAGVAVNIPTDTIKAGVERLKNVKGRFERVVSSKGWTAIIDYAHTPDALEKCLKTIHDVLPEAHRGRIITVFGAGGDRDKTKRPLMGKVAQELSDIVIVTSDNPRTENPDAIIDDIIAGMTPGEGVERQTDRGKAIELAAKRANKGDVVLIAGKGHEDYQVLGAKKVHFSDREVVEEFL